MKPKKATPMGGREQRLEAALRKVIAWLETLAKQADGDEVSNRGRFDHLADSCKADAKNYRATAADLQRAISGESVV